MSPQLRITLLYAGACVAWIAFSDSIMFSLIGDRVELIYPIGTIKGIIFMMVTAVGLFSLLNSEFHRQYDRKQHILASEQKLEATNHTLQTIIDASPIAIYVVDNQWKVLTWSPAAEQLFGWTAAEVIGKKLEHVPEDRREEAREYGKRIFSGEKLPTVEVERLRKDGARLFMRMATAARFDASNQVVSILVMAQDITVEKAAQANLLYQASLMENVSDAIIAIDIMERVTSWNKAAETLYGWSSAEVMGKPIDAVFHTEYVGFTREEVRHSFVEASGWQGEVIQNRKDGTPITIHSATTLLRDVNGRPSGIVGINRDMTWQRELAAETQKRQTLQQDLEQELEMRTMRNRFVTMVSHEFRTPLAAIQSSTDILLHYIDRLTLEKRQKYLTQVQEQIGQITDLMNDFLTLSRVETVGVQYDPKPVDLNYLLHEVIDAARGSWRNRVIELKLEDPCPPVVIDRKLMRQAIQNLLSNGLKYSPPHCPVVLSLTCANRMVRIEVNDQGIGIPEGEQGRMSEPFFRASNVGSTEGTGLGLAIVRRAVEAHGGRLSIESVAGMGSTIGFSFPLRESHD